MKPEFKKGEVPLGILKVMERFLKHKGEIFESVESNDSLLKMRDVDGLKYFFEVKAFKHDPRRGHLITIHYRPTDENNTNPHEAEISASDLENRFKSWLEILENYRFVKTIYDDPILKHYTDEYFTEFDIIDEDADVKPFAENQILYLDQYVNWIAKEIDEYKTDKNANEIESIKIEIEEFKTTMTSKTKRSVIKSLSKLCARVRKQGIEPMKKFLGETAKDYIKDTLKNLVTEGAKYIIRNHSEIVKQIGEIGDNL